MVEVDLSKLFVVWWQSLEEDVGEVQRGKHHHMSAFSYDFVTSSVTHLYIQIKIIIFLLFLLFLAK